MGDSNDISNSVGRTSGSIFSPKEPQVRMNKLTLYARFIIIIIISERTVLDPQVNSRRGLSLNDLQVTLVYVHIWASRVCVTVL